MRRRVKREVKREEHVSVLGKWEMFCSLRKDWTCLWWYNKGYDPWGKPGGGAPSTSTSGHVIAAVYGNFEGKKKEQVSI